MKRAWIAGLAFVFCCALTACTSGLFGYGTTHNHENSGLSGGASAPQSGSPSLESSGSAALPVADADKRQAPASKTVPTNAPELPVAAGGTAEVRGSDPSHTLSHLTVVDDRTAWVVRTAPAGADSVAVTDDGGATWNERAGMGERHVLALRAVSSTSGWAAASSECKVQEGTNRCSQLQILGTRDGGRTWTDQFTLATDSQQAEIETQDDRHAIVLAGGKLLRSKDSGRHWNELKLGVAGFVPHRISFPTAQQGWASGSLCENKQADGSVSCRIMVMRTSDGGAHWKQLPQDGELLAGSVSSLIRFVDAKHGWLLSSDFDAMRATLFATSDGGDRWVPLQQLNSARPAPTGLEFVSPEIGWIPLSSGAGPIEGGMMATYDGGRHFETIGAERGWSFEQASALSAKDVWAIEHGRTVVRTTDGGKTWRQLYPQPAPSRDIAFVDPQYGFGLGTPFDHNALMTTADGGETWHLLPSIGTQESIAAISFINKQNGWVLRQTSDAGVLQLLQTKDGGQSWTALANLAVSGASSRPYFRFFSEQDGVLAAADAKTQTVYRTKDGGRTWTAAPSPYVQAGGGNLFDFSSPSVGWTYRDASPEQGAVLYRTEDGASWKPFGVLPKPGWAYALGWSSDQRGWALYQHDPFKAVSRWSLLATADGGGTWRETVFPADFRLDERSAKLQFIDVKHGWLLCGSGVLRTEDGGANWTWLG